MAFTKKTAFEKFETKVKNLLLNKKFTKTTTKVKFQTSLLFEYSRKSIKYEKNRCYISKVDPISIEDFKVEIILNNDNLSLINSNISNPPQQTRNIIDLFRKTLKKDFNKIVLGSNDNKIILKTIYITKELYNIISSINKEESRDKNVRFTNRAIPFLKKYYNVNPEEKEFEKDYTLMLKELIVSGTLNQEDIISLTQKLNAGNNSDLIIKQQVHKQVEWLIESIQTIIDEPKLTRDKAKQLGNKIFGFMRSEIKGPEHLMEMILTKFGQYTIFGSPVLLNTDKFILNDLGLPRSQFDIILINHLSDMEVVELKRPDTPILDYDEDRNKFYASIDLSIAISQAERYISAVYRDNDEDYKIDNLKIREYINNKIGGSMTVEITRPTALIVIGRYQTIAKNYDSLSKKIKDKILKTEYEKNYLMAYKELKGAYKNINITSYSELIESARTRMIITKD
jgi:hypothetical protein